MEPSSQANICTHCHSFECPPNDKELCVCCNMIMSLALILCNSINNLDEVTAYKIAEEQMEYICRKCDEIVQLMKIHKHLM